MSAFRIRPAAVAGQFYPAVAGQLASTVDDLLSNTRGSGERPRALIVPHAGYRYSGLLAARAYRELLDGGWHPRRIVLLGPPHHAPVDGIAAPGVTAFATPLGDVHLDVAAIEGLLDEGAIELSERAHATEHSLEVHLPFLQEALGDFLLIPLLVGDVEPERVARVLDRLMDEDTLIIASTDLSHFHGEREARRLDHTTLERMLRLAEDLDPEAACGCHAVNGLNHLARQRGWHPALLGYCNSADAGGPEDRVVGYGALALRRAA